MKKPTAKASQVTTRQEIVQQAWAGPLPPPQILRDFDQIVENGAERIMAAWENETAHRRAMEKRELKLIAYEAIFGKFCALIFVLAALGATAYAIHEDCPWIAALLGTGTIAAVVWAFVKISRPEKK